MDNRTTEFNSADYLDSAEAIAVYLDAWLEDGTPEELRNALTTRKPVVRNDPVDPRREWSRLTVEPAQTA